MTSIADELRAAAPLKLWDVLNAEAHVRTIAATWLRVKRAHLKPDKREDLDSYLFAECWRISGLGPDGKTMRPDAFEYFAVVEISFASPAWSSVAGAITSSGLRLGPFTTPATARSVGDGAVLEARTAGDRAVVEVLEQRARGIYNPAVGIAFSTYSWRTLSLRIVDWYRETFGDSRYGEHRIAVSLNALAEDENETVEGFLDRHMPGARDHSADELHRHVYDHVLADEAVANAIAG